jgi:hypothetical protein
MSQHRTIAISIGRGIAVGCYMLALAFSSSGCGGPKIPPEELGEVLTELPKLPEAEKPYEHPELVADGLDVPAAKSEAEAAAESAATEASAETAPATPEVAPATPDASAPATAQSGEFSDATSSKPK